MENSLKFGIDKALNLFHADADAVKSAKDVEELRIKYVGKKGVLVDFFKQLAQASPEEKRQLGKAINSFKSIVNNRLSELKKMSGPSNEGGGELDETLPGVLPVVGREHPLMKIMNEIKSIFSEMGFSIEMGPEIETDFYNFEALNVPADHPSRDMQDTFYLPNNFLLRTHTSPVQIRTMQTSAPPIRIIAPGRCFRKDTPDATHSPMFYQVEGLVVDEGVSFAKLKGVLLAFMQKMFGEHTKIRFRPSFFPFTEPSAEYDVSCPFCAAKGCKVCKESGWLEISGAGMVDPAVFGFVDYDAERYTGYAFGMGIERIAMLKYQINDIRLFYENDLRFLNQF